MDSIDQRTDTMLAENGLDAIIGSTRSTIRYLSGMDYPVTAIVTEERAFVVWTPERRVLLSPPWTEPYAQELARPGVEVRFIFYPTWPIDALVSLLKDVGISSGVVGIEAEYLPTAVADAVRSALPGLELRAVDVPILRNRAQKSPEEVEKMRAASRAAELGMIDAIAATGVGVTERDFSFILRDAVLANGADSIAWLALRWGDDGQRMTFRDVPIEPGTLINIEMGCSVDGYLSDVQRMVASSPVEARVARAYKEFQDLLLRTMLNIRPGMTNPDVYQMFERDMAQTGLDDWNSYFLGHGIGLDAHEDHLFWKQSDQRAVIPDNSFFALEPAILSPRLLSLEDTVYVTAQGNDVVSSHGDWSELVVLGQRVDISADGDQGKS